MTLALFYYIDIDMNCCVFIMLVMLHIATVQSLNIRGLSLKVNALSQGCQTQFLKGRSPAEFASNFYVKFNCIFISFMADSFGNKAIPSIPMCVLSTTLSAPNSIENY